MERLTEEHKFCVFASLKDKKLAQVGAFKDYETFYAVMIAMNKLYEYENTGLEPKEVEKLKHDLAVRDKALELALISRKEMLEKQNCFTCSVEKAKIEFLEQAERELKGK